MVQARRMTNQRHSKTLRGLAFAGLATIAIIGGCDAFHKHNSEPRYPPILDMDSDRRYEDRDQAECMKSTMNILRGWSINDLPSKYPLAGIVNIEMCRWVPEKTPSILQSCGDATIDPIEFGRCVSHKAAELGKREQCAVQLAQTPARLNKELLDACEKGEVEGYAQCLKGALALSKYRVAINTRRITHCVEKMRGNLSRCKRELSAIPPQLLPTTAVIGCIYDDGTITEVYKQCAEEIGITEGNTPYAIRERLEKCVELEREKQICERIASESRCRSWKSVWQHVKNTGLAVRVRDAPVKMIGGLLIGLLGISAIVFGLLKSKERISRAVQDWTNTQRENIIKKIAASRLIGKNKVLDRVIEWAIRLLSTDYWAKIEAFERVKKKGMRGSYGTNLQLIANEKKTSETFRGIHMLLFALYHPRKQIRLEMLKKIDECLDTKFLPQTKKTMHVPKYAYALISEIDFFVTDPCAEVQEMVLQIQRRIGELKRRGIHLVCIENDFKHEGIDLDEMFRKHAGAIMESKHTGSCAMSPVNGERYHREKGYVYERYDPSADIQMGVPGYRVSLTPSRSLLQNLNQRACRISCEIPQLEMYGANRLLRARGVLEENWEVVGLMEEFLTVDARTSRCLNMNRYGTKTIGHLVDTDRPKLPEGLQRLQEEYFDKHTDVFIRIKEEVKVGDITIVNQGISHHIGPGERSG